MASERAGGLVLLDPPPALCEVANPITTEAWGVDRVPLPQVIPKGTAELVMNTTATGTWSGFQMGASLDGGEIHWSETFDEGSYSLAIPVLPDQFEDGTHRWEFWMRLQLGSNGSDCSSGYVYSGDRTIEVFAVPG